MPSVMYVWYCWFVQENWSFVEIQESSFYSLEKPSIYIVEGTNDINMNTTPTMTKPACVKQGKAQSSKCFTVYIDFFICINIVNIK